PKPRRADGIQISLGAGWRFVRDRRARSARSRAERFMLQVATVAYSNQAVFSRSTRPSHSSGTTATRTRQQRAHTESHEERASTLREAYEPVSVLWSSSPRHGTDSPRISRTSNRSTTSTQRGRTQQCALSFHLYSYPPRHRSPPLLRLPSCMTPQDFQLTHQASFGAMAGIRTSGGKRRWVWYGYTSARSSKRRARNDPPINLQEQGRETRTGAKDSQRPPGPMPRAQGRPRIRGVLCARGLWCNLDSARKTHSTATRPVLCRARRSARESAGCSARAARGAVSRPSMVWTAELAEARRGQRGQDRLAQRGESVRSHCAHGPAAMNALVFRAPGAHLRSLRLGVVARGRSAGVQRKSPPPARVSTSTYFHLLFHIPV
ncbi:hypothetical protein FB451DRAFT_1481989, partial [Mycena latifolia]